MPKYYSIKEIDKMSAQYNLIFGERSNGKTSAVLEKILINWCKKGEQGAYVRRYDEEIKGSKGESVFSSIADERGLVTKYTQGKYQRVVYYNRRWYLATYDADLDKTVKQGEPFCFAFAVNQGTKYKSTAYPGVTTILYDEFITSDYYLRDEFVEFSNLLSTIIRQRDNVKIYMCGNTVDKYRCPYWQEMGLLNVKKMTPGTIECYTYGESGLKAAVEYCANSKKGKASDVYFAFNNPKLKMITQGSWEMPMYPHAPFKIKQKNIIDYFFITYREVVLQGDIVLQDDSLFIFIHEKTTPIKDDIKQTYELDFNPRYNHSVSILRGTRNQIAEKIAELFRKDLVYYQDNDIGEVVRGYIHASEKRNALTI